MLRLYIKKPKSIAYFYIIHSCFPPPSLMLFSLSLSQVYTFVTSRYKLEHAGYVLHIKKPSTTVVDTCHVLYGSLSFAHSSYTFNTTGNLLWLSINSEHFDAHHLRVLSQQQRTLTVWPCPPPLHPSTRRINSHRFLRHPLVGSHRQRLPLRSLLRTLNKTHIIECGIRACGENTEIWNFYPEVNVCSMFSRNDALASYCTEARVSQELE